MASTSLSHYFVITSRPITVPSRTGHNHHVTHVIPRLLLVGGMAALNAQVVSELAAGLEGAIGVALQLSVFSDSSYFDLVNLHHPQHQPEPDAHEPHVHPALQAPWLAPSPW